MSNLSKVTEAENKRLKEKRQEAKMRAGSDKLKERVKKAVKASKDRKSSGQYDAPAFDRDLIKDAESVTPSKKSMPLPKSKPQPPKKKKKENKKPGVSFDVSGTFRNGGMNAVPSKYEGFSKLPEGVQEKISPDLAKKYKTGGMSKAVMKKRGGTFKGTF